MFGPKVPLGAARAGSRAVNSFAVPWHTPAAQLDTVSGPRYILFILLRNQEPTIWVSGLLGMLVNVLASGLLLLYYQ